MVEVTLKSQKIIKVGNSLAVTLDRGFLTQHKLKAGDVLVARYSSEAPVICLSTPVGMKQMGTQEKMVSEEKLVYMATKITPELKKWMDNFLKKNKESIDKLADL